MACRAKAHNAKNHARQIRYLHKGIIMLPKLKDEKNIKENN